MSVVEVMSLLSFFGCMGIFFLKLYNIVGILTKKNPNVTDGKTTYGYDGVWIFIGWAGYLILWLFSMSILLNDPATNPAISGFYLLSYTMLTFFLFLTTMLSIIEFLLSFGSISDTLQGKSTMRGRGISSRTP